MKLEQLDEGLGGALKNLATSTYQTGVDKVNAVEQSKTPWATLSKEMGLNALGRAAKAFHNNGKTTKQQPDPQQAAQAIYDYFSRLPKAQRQRELRKFAQQLQSLMAAP